MLDKLYKELHIDDTFDKIIIAACVMNTLLENDCGVTPDNVVGIQLALADGLCKPYQFDAMLLAAKREEDIDDLLKHRFMYDGSLYEDHIWKFLQENEIYPGVKMK